MTKISDIGIDWSFIREVEGWKAKAYVPEDKDGDNSGVTVCMGYDIGQQTRRSILSLNLSPALFAKIEPYIGAKGAKARYILEHKPLYLLPPETKELDEKTRQQYYDQIAREYDDNSDYTFCMLNKPIQTVILSLGYQYGSLKKRCPKFFAAITKGQWKVAISELENFGDAYQTRRLKEAALLKSGV